MQNDSNAESSFESFLYYSLCIETICLKYHICLSDVWPLMKSLTCMPVDAFAAVSEYMRSWDKNCLNYFWSTFNLSPVSIVFSICSNWMVDYAFPPHKNEGSCCQFWQINIILITLDTRSYLNYSATINTQSLLPLEFEHNLSSRR